MAEPMLLNLVLLKLRFNDPSGTDFYQPFLTDFSQVFPAIWAAFKEIKAFYNTGDERLKIRCFFAAEQMENGWSLLPKNVSSTESIWQRVVKSLNETRPQARTLSPEEFIPIFRSQVDAFAKIETRNTYESERIAIWMNDRLRQEGYEGENLIVIDQEITPPRKWRYMIWSGRNKVVSIAPVDPAYWGMSDPHLISTIKHRVRTACLSVIGSMLHLERCDNETCFLFKNVDSVLRLDWMIHLGPEHKLEALAGKGFLILTEDPGMVQPICDLH